MEENNENEKISRQSHNEGSQLELIVKCDPWWLG